MKLWALSLPVIVVGAPALVLFLRPSAPGESPEHREASAAHAAAPAASPCADPKVPLPSVDMVQLARQAPVRFLEQCLSHYDREVRGYHCVFRKQERIAGRLQPRETIDVWFRERPYSVLFRWLEGARKAEAALYVEGQNGGKMLARPSGTLTRRLVGDVVERDVAGPDARQSGRYPLSQFGVRKGMERTLAAWRAADGRGQLHVEYLGEQAVKEVGDRVCHKLRRTYEAPENDGVTELTAYIDRDTWLQIGSVLKGEGGQLIGEYFFCDLQLNPEYKPAQFGPVALGP